MQGSNAERFGNEIRQMVVDAEKQEIPEQKEILVQGPEGVHVVMIAISPAFKIKPEHADEVQYDFTKQHLKRKLPQLDDPTE